MPFRRNGKLKIGVGNFIQDGFEDLLEYAVPIVRIRWTKVGFAWELRSARNHPLRTHYRLTNHPDLSLVCNLHQLLKWESWWSSFLDNGRHLLEVLPSSGITELQGKAEVKLNFLNWTTKFLSSTFSILAKCQSSSVCFARQLVPALIWLDRWSWRVLDQISGSIILKDHHYS